MTTLGASDIVGAHIRDVRQRLGWSAQKLADECQGAGAAHITKAVVTNLETRRRGGRAATVEDVFLFARVLGVPPLLLMVPLDAGDVLEVVPGVELGPIDAVNWAAGDTYAFVLWTAENSSPRATDEVLRRTDPEDALAHVRELRAVVKTMKSIDKSLQGDDPASDLPERMQVMANRLMHIASRMAALGYDPPGVADAAPVLRRHGLPATLDEWRNQPASPEPGPGDEGWPDV